MFRERITSYLKRYGSESIILLIIGVVCHGWVMFNHYPMYSGLTEFISTYEIEVSEGRWMAAILMWINGDVLLPWLDGIEALVLLTVSGIIVSEIYKVENKLLRVLIGAIIITSPVITTSLLFLYMAEVFTGALFFSTVAVFLLFSKDGWKRYVLYALFLFLSISTYQVYVAYAVMLVVVYEIRQLLIGVCWRKVTLESITIAITTMVSMVLYAIVNKLVNAMLGIKQTMVMGYPKEFINILRQIKKCYMSFFYYMWDGSVNSYFIMRIISVIEIVLFIYIVFKVVKNSTHNRFDSFMNVAIILFSMLITPIICFFIHLTDMGKTYDSVPRMCAPTIPLFFALIIYIDNVNIKKALLNMDGTERSEKKRGFILSRIILVISILITWVQIVVANTMYMSVHITYEKEYSLALRIVDRIEQSEEYVPGMPVYIIGSSKGVYGGKADDSYIEKFIPGMEKWGNSIMQSESGIILFINQFIQTDMNIKDGSKADIASDVIGSIGVFPESNSIKYCGDYFVVKIE